MCVGKSVLYYPSGNTQLEPIPATVLAVGEYGLDLLFRPNQSEYLYEQSGVRHVDDKTANEIIRMESGGWDFTEDDIRLYTLRPELGAWPENMDEARKLKTPMVAPPQ